MASRVREPVAHALGVPRPTRLVTELPRRDGGRFAEAVHDRLDVRVVESARSRPVTPRYTEVSDVIRSNMNAFLAGTKSAEGALADMKSRLAPIYR